MRNQCLLICSKCSRPFCEYFILIRILSYHCPHISLSLPNWSPYKSCKYAAISFSQRNRVILQNYHAILKKTRNTNIAKITLVKSYILRERAKTKLKVICVCCIYIKEIFLLRFPNEANYSLYEFKNRNAFNFK